MIYRVKAKLIEGTIGEFYRKLVDGAVANQRPDGGGCLLLGRTGHVGMWEMALMTRSRHREITTSAR